MSDAPNPAASTSTSEGVLASELRRVNAESAKRRAALKDLRKQLDDAAAKITAHAAEKTTWETERTSLVADRDGWKSKYEAAPSELGQEVDRLKGEIREGKHKAAFQGLYDDQDLGLNPDVPTDRLWQILGHKPEADDVDVVALKAKVAALRATDKYLFRTAATAEEPAQGGAKPGSTPAPRPTIKELPPGPGAHRGSADPDSGGWMTVTRTQLRDPVFTKANQARMAAAQREGRFRMIEG